MKDAGYKVFGAGMGQNGLNDKLEYDRVFALKVMKDNGIKIPKTFPFDTIDKGLEFVRQTKKGYVIKPFGDATSDRTFVGKTADELISEMEGWKKDKVKDKFILQELIKGLEVDTEVYLSHGKIVRATKALFETKKFMNDDLGPNTGCSSSISFGYKNPDSKMYVKTIKKLEKFFANTDYTGYFSINCIIQDSDQEPYGLEFNPRCGYSDTYATMGILPMEYGKFVSDMVEGKLKGFEWKSGYGASLRLTVPPYPLLVPDDEKDKTYIERIKKISNNIKIDGIDLKDKWIIPYDMQKKDGLEMAGIDGIVCEVLSAKGSLMGLKKDLYARADKIKVPNKQYRTDVVENCMERLKKFAALGYESPYRGGL